MHHSSAMGRQVRSASALRVACCCCCCCTLLLAVLCMPMCTWAYDVRYTAVTSPDRVSARYSGYCPFHSGSHTMMPMRESFQLKAAELLHPNSFTEAPIGGWNTFGSCSSDVCVWIFTTGLMNGTSIDRSIFFRGVIHNGIDFTRSIPGMYNNFEKMKQPISFARPQDHVIPKMQRNYRWANELRDYTYQNWICEQYVFTDEELATAPLTDEYGFVIQLPQSSFPWWAGLLIALGVVIPLIIIISICCLIITQNNASDKTYIYTLQLREVHIQTPRQSELAFSRRASMMSHFSDAGGAAYPGGPFSELGPMGMGQFNSGYAANPLAGDHPPMGSFAIQSGHMY